MTSGIDSAWNRVEAWLRVNAPSVWARLGPPATDAEIAEVENVYGMNVPAEVSALWRRFNGMTSGPMTTAEIIPPGGLVPASTFESIADHRRRSAMMVSDIEKSSEFGDRMESYRRDPAGWANDEWVYLNEWLIITFGSDYLFVDCRRGEKYGCVMEAFSIGGQFGPHWSSLTDMWCEVADILESIDPADPPGPIQTSVGIWTINPSWWGGRSRT